MPANFADLLSSEVTPDKDYRFFGQLHAHFERLGQEVDGQRENLAKIQVHLSYRSKIIKTTLLLVVLIFISFTGTPTNELYAMSFALLSITAIAQFGLNFYYRRNYTHFKMANVRMQWEWVALSSIDLLSLIVSFVFLIVITQVHQETLAKFLFGVDLAAIVLATFFSSWHMGAKAEHHLVYYPVTIDDLLQQWREIKSLFPLTVAAIEV